MFKGLAQEITDIINRTKEKVKHFKKAEKTSKSYPLKAMPRMSQEEQDRIRNTPIQELLESGDWVKIYDLDRPKIEFWDSSAFKAREEAYKKIDEMLENVLKRERT